MTIQEVVAEKISKSGDTVKDTVVNKLVDVEVSKRVDTISKAMSKIETLDKEFKKIDGKNDQISYNSGVKVESMSEKRFQEIQKSKQSIDNLKKAFDLALETNTQESYTKLNGLLGGDTKQCQAEVKPEA